jgi:hypothetical protein
MHSIRRKWRRKNDAFGSDAVSKYYSGNFRAVYQLMPRAAIDRDGVHACMFANR